MLVSRAQIKFLPSENVFFERQDDARKDKCAQAKATVWNDGRWDKATVISPETLGHSFPPM